MVGIFEIRCRSVRDLPVPAFIPTRHWPWPPQLAMSRFWPANPPLARGCHDLRVLGVKRRVKSRKARGESGTENLHLPYHLLYYNTIADRFCF